MEAEIPMKTIFPRSVWVGVCRFVFIVVLAIVFFVLGQTMARHRFHEGGRYRWDVSVGQ